jgi:hypothetical protein
MSRTQAIRRRWIRFDLLSVRKSHRRDAEAAEIAQRKSQIRILGKSNQHARIFIVANALDDSEARF